MLFCVFVYVYEWFVCFCVWTLVVWFKINGYGYGFRAHGVETLCPRSGHLCPRLSHLCPRSSQTCPRSGHLCPRLSHLCPRSCQTCPRLSHLCPPSSQICPQLSHLCPLSSQSCPPVALRGAGSFPQLEPLDGFSRLWLKWRVLIQECAFWGCWWQPTILRDSNPQKPPKRRRR